MFPFSEAPGLCSVKRETTFPLRPATVACHALAMEAPGGRIRCTASPCRHCGTLTVREAPSGRVASVTTTIPRHSSSPGGCSWASERGG
eukprot:scaffold26367_cov62-Isochrysis_galbana.AAC.1